jgi:hypothetical protein
VDSSDPLNITPLFVAGNCTKSALRQQTSNNIYNKNVFQPEINPKRNKEHNIVQFPATNSGVIFNSGSEEEPTDSPIVPLDANRKLRFQKGGDNNIDNSAANYSPSDKMTGDRMRENVDDILEDIIKGNKASNEKELIDAKARITELEAEIIKLSNNLDKNRLANLPQIEAKDNTDVNKDTYIACLEQNHNLREETSNTKLWFCSRHAMYVSLLTSVLSLAAI